MNISPILIHAFFVTCLATLSTQAQETSTLNTDVEQKQQSHSDFFEEIIVTGTTGGGQSKFETSYAISDFSADDIQRLAPTSTANLLAQTPGVYVEASAGEASNVYRIRGIPNEGSNQAFQEDGMPIYPETQGFFFFGDGTMRTDIMTERFEFVRGGPAPVYATNAAAIYNQITRQGTAQAEGAVRLTLGDSGLYRAESYWSGPIAKRTYLAAGGFIRYHDGYRDNGYPSDEGGQFRVNLRHDFDKGMISGFVKYFNEQNTFYLAIPLNDPFTGESLNQYIDFHKGTLNTPALKNAKFKYNDENGNLVTENRDLSNGRQTNYINLGFDFDWDFTDDWSLSNKLRYTKGELSFDALYSSQPKTSAELFAASKLTTAMDNFPGATQVGYFTAGTNAGEAFDPSLGSGLVAINQYRGIESIFDAIQNDLRISRRFDLLGEHNLTLGLYATNFATTGVWRSQEYLLEVKNQPHVLDLVALDAQGNVLGFITDEGTLGYSSTLLAGRSNIDEWSYYLADTWTINDKLKIEFGIREVNRSGEGAFFLTTQSDLGDTTTLADNAVKGFNGKELEREFDESYKAYTIGTNYQLTDHIGLYARTSRSVRGSSEFNLILPLDGEQTKATQQELGIKYDTQTFSAFATLFRSSFNPFNTTLFEVDPNTGELDLFPLLAQWIVQA